VVEFIGRRSSQRPIRPSWSRYHALAGRGTGRPCKRFTIGATPSFSCCSTSRTRNVPTSDRLLNGPTNVV
jgi:hypothetical protein